jgi:hypothetical protein
MKILLQTLATLALFGALPALSAQAEYLEPVRVDGHLTYQQADVLAKASEACETFGVTFQALLDASRTAQGPAAPLSELRDRAFAQTRACLARDHGITETSDERVRDARLQEIYNELAAAPVTADIPPLKEMPVSPDAYHRFRLLATTGPGDTVCHEIEWLQVIVDTQRAGEHPLTQGEMERFVSAAFLETIGKADCNTPSPRLVHYIFTVSDQVVSEQALAPKWENGGGRLWPDRRQAEAFGRQVGGKVLDAIYAAL